MKSHLDVASNLLLDLGMLVSEIQGQIRLASVKATDVAPEHWSEIERALAEIRTLAENTRRLVLRDPPLVCQRRLPVILD